MMTLMSLVFVAFMVLKLGGWIGWSWWWVSAPLWGAVLLYVVIGVGAFAMQRWARRRLEDNWK